MTVLSTQSHLAAFSALLAHDAQAGRLNMRDLQVLALVVSNREPIGVGEMATMLSISPPAASRIANKLVDRGLLRRFGIPTDRRIALLEPTPEGHALNDQVRSYFESSANQSVSA